VTLAAFGIGCAVGAVAATICTLALFAAAFVWVCAALQKGIEAESRAKLGQDQSFN
jgi:hypothetical protein